MTFRIWAPAKRSAIAAVFLIGLPLTAAQVAAARPKVQSNGCTAAQIQSPQAKACIDQLNKDVLAGVRYVHALFCDASGMSCCQTDGTRTFNCQSVSSVRGAGQSQSVPTSAGAFEPPGTPCRGPQCSVGPPSNVGGVQPPQNPPPRGGVGVSPPTTVGNQQPPSTGGTTTIYQRDSGGGGGGGVRR